MTVMEIKTVVFYVFMVSPHDHIRIIGLQHTATAQLIKD